MTLVLLFRPQWEGGQQPEEPCSLTGTGVTLGTQTLAAAPLCVGGQSLSLTPNDPQPL